MSAGSGRVIVTPGGGEGPWYWIPKGYNWGLSVPGKAGDVAFVWGAFVGWSGPASFTDSGASVFVFTADGDLNLWGDTCSYSGVTVHVWTPPA